MCPGSEVVQRDLRRWSSRRIRARESRAETLSASPTACDRLAGLRMLEPVGYLDFLKLMASARLVLTDSGGIQEETTILQVPCLTLRENTERPITAEVGTNRIVGQQPERILAAYREVRGGLAGEPQIPPLWDGHAAERILQILRKAL